MYGAMVAMGNFDPGMSSVYYQLTASCQRRMHHVGGTMKNRVYRDAMSNKWVILRDLLKQGFKAISGKVIF